MDVKYVLPNLSTFNQRGSIENRSRIAEEICDKHNRISFQMVEIPADFVKNQSEVSKTCLPLGSMLTTEYVGKIYDSEDGISKPYCLHTEPGIPRRVARTSITSKLRWFDQSWIDSFHNHVLSIIEFIGKPPTAIEVHPGTQQKKMNNLGSLIFGLKSFMIRLEDSIDCMPEIFIENRTPHIISSGYSIKTFRDELLSIDSNDGLPIGIILDIQQLYSKTKERFVEEIRTIPHDIIKGFHIHQLHRTPVSEGTIDWSVVREFIHSGKYKSKLHILPEVHHMNQLIETYSFCTDFLGFKNADDR